MGEKGATLDSWELPDVFYDILLRAIPAKTSAMGRPIKVDFRKILRGIFFVLRTGIQWRAVPREKFGPPGTVYYYFSKSRRAGVFAAMAPRAPEVHDARRGIDREWRSFDGAVTEAPFGCEATGPNPTDRGKLGTKRFLLADGRRVPLSVVPAGANADDFKILEKTIRSVRIDGAPAFGAFFENDYIPHNFNCFFSPACFGALSSVPGGMSTSGFPDTVTVPDFTGYLNCR